jgi:MarR family transcriptional regulator, organic hydroperoxide resistance regulator
MKPEETIDFQLRKAWFNISKMYNAEAARYKGTMSVGFVLLSIDVKEGTPSTKLGPKMGMEPGSLSRILKSLEEDGLIERKTDSKDKRSVRVYLTPKGIEKRDIARKTVITFNEIARAKISAKKLDVFFEVLENINSIIEKKEIYKENIPKES